MNIWQPLVRKDTCISQRVDGWFLAVAVKLIAKTPFIGHSLRKNVYSEISWRVVAGSCWRMLAVASMKLVSKKFTVLH